MNYLQGYSDTRFSNTLLATPNDVSPSEILEPVVGVFLKHKDRLQSMSRCTLVWRYYDLNWMKGLWSRKQEYFTAKTQGLWSRGGGVRGENAPQYF